MQKIMTLMKEIKDDINRWRDIPCSLLFFERVCEGMVLIPHKFGRILLSCYLCLDFSL